MKVPTGHGGAHGQSQYWKTEARGPWVPRQSELYSKIKANLGYIVRLCLNKPRVGNVTQW
jgi:hypothetical protein